MKTLLFLLALTLSGSATPTLLWQTAKVTKVSDGDTVWLQDGHKHFKARLIGLDTFETKMNHRVFMQMSTLNDLHPRKTHTAKEVLAIGHKTARWVKNRILNKTIQYHSYGTDKYGRELIYIKNINYLLIRYGMAIQYPTNKLHIKRKKFLLDASREANLEKRGIYGTF